MGLELIFLFGLADVDDDDADDVLDRHQRGLASVHVLDCHHGMSYVTLGVRLFRGT